MVWFILFTEVALMYIQSKHSSKDSGAQTIVSI